MVMLNRTSVIKLSNDLVIWLKDYVRSVDKKGVILGLSGGVDSSVVAVLCKKAFPSSTLGIIMPCHSNDRDRHDAEAFANIFSISCKTINLDSAYDALLDKLENEDNDHASCNSNIKPRLRMITLYYFANKMDYLVVGTGNRSELSVGYFTKYGDGGVDLLPIGGLLKSEVYELAQYLGIPDYIISKSPSAGLWEGQTDEGQLGVSYKELDEYLSARDSGNNYIDTLMNNSEHKRQLPIIPYLRIQ